MMNEGGDDNVADWDRPQAPSSGSDAQAEAGEPPRMPSDPALQQRVLSVCYDNQAAQAVGQDGQAAPTAGIGPGTHRFQNVAHLLVGEHRGVDIISQGSPIIRVLSFAGGVTSAVMCVFALLNPVLMLLHPLMWAVHFYQFIFSVSTLVFEAKAEWVHNFNMLEKYKETLVENARFIAKCLGRGLFYIFQATLRACLGYSQPESGASKKKAEDRVSELYHFVACCLSLYFFLLGVAHILMHFGIMPSHYAVSLNRLGEQTGGRVQTVLQSLRERTTTAPSTDQRANLTTSSDVELAPRGSA
jgi:hypothetical protein